MKHSLDELKEIAEGMFAEKPHEPKAYAFSDGNIFFESDKNFAILHKNQSKKDWFEIENEKYVAATNATDSEDTDTGSGLDAGDFESGKGSQTEDEPSDRWNKEKLTQWMADKGIGFEEADTKKVLLEKISAFKNQS